MEDADNFDEMVGKNVQVLRESIGISQAKLADAVSSQGRSSLHQQTIVKIEKGTRPLKLSEAVELAWALDTKVELLFEADELVIDRAARLRSCIERFHEAERGIAAAAKHFDTARGALALWAGSARGHVPANVIKQAEYLANRDVITQIKVAMQEEENSRQQYQDVDGQREVVPSDYHRDGAGAQ